MATHKNLDDKNLNTDEFPLLLRSWRLIQRFVESFQENALRFVILCKMIFIAFAVFSLYVYLAVCVPRIAESGWVEHCSACNIVVRSQCLLILSYSNRRHLQQKYHYTCPELTTSSFYIITVHHYPLSLFTYLISIDSVTTYKEEVLTSFCAVSFAKSSQCCILCTYILRILVDL